MAIRYTCPCRAEIRLPTSAVGRRARCKQCGVVFTVPAPVAGQEPALAGHTPEPELTPAIPDLTDNHERSFWSDLAWSFVLFLDPQNMATCIGLMVMMVFAAIASILPIAGLFVGTLTTLFLLAFFLNVILEVASGEEELPNLWIDSWWDLIPPLFQFLGSWVYVGLPAIASLWITWQVIGEPDWSLAYGLTLVGMVFWPAVILAVVIGGGFQGLWPHTIVRTALAEPLAYLVVCAVVLIVPGFDALLDLDVVQAALGELSFSATLAVTVFVGLIDLCVVIIAMRAIGLYYRHFKHRFPWIAE
jgi:hypothetical protein